MGRKPGTAADVRAVQGVARRLRWPGVKFGSLAVATLVAGGLVAAVCALASGDLQAKSALDSPYGYERTWNAALRLVRVDNGWKITEKDDASGYLLFEYKSPESTKTTPGSLELVRATRDASVSVLVQLPQMPHYHEQVILDALASKMRREYGDPPARKPPVVIADAGAE